MDENFICVYDGNKAIGFYNLSDLNLEENLIQNKNQDMKSLEKKNRVISTRLF